MVCLQEKSAPVPCCHIFTLSTWKLADSLTCLLHGEQKSFLLAFSAVALHSRMLYWSTKTLQPSSGCGIAWHRHHCCGELPVGWGKILYIQGKLQVSSLVHGCICFCKSRELFWNVKYNILIIVLGLASKLLSILNVIQLETIEQSIRQQVHGLHRFWVAANKDFTDCSHLFLCYIFFTFI